MIYLFGTKLETINTKYKWECKINSIEDNISLFMRILYIFFFENCK